MTIIDGCVERKIESPIYVAIDELINIRTEESIVVIERHEFPIHFTPYSIKQELTKRGSSLAVLDAEPLGCLVAYEKIIMQRLQLLAERMTSNNQEVTKNTCAHPTILIDISQNIEEQMENQLMHFDFSKEKNIIVKPTYSTLGANIFCCSKDILLEKLMELKSTYHSAKPYHRTAEDVLRMVSVGTSGTFSGTKSDFKENCRKMGADSLLAEFDTRDKQDPFFIIQPIKSDVVLATHSLVLTREYLPTYRTFILVAQDSNTPDNVSVQLLSKVQVILPQQHYSANENIRKSSVVAGNSHKSRSYIEKDNEIYECVIEALNTPQTKKFFSFIFGGHQNILRQLQTNFPEQENYWRSISTYPPYQRMFNLPIPQTETIRYQNIMMLYRLMRFSNYKSADQLATSLTLLELYTEIKRKNHAAPSYIKYFLISFNYANNMINFLLVMYENKNNPFLVALNIKRLLGSIEVYTDALKLLKDSNYIDLIYDCTKKVLKLFELLFPDAKKLRKPPSQPKLDQNWVEFFKQKSARDTAIDLTIGLFRAEPCLIDARSSEKSKAEEIVEHRLALSQWSTLYFHSIQITKEIIEPAYPSV